MLTTVAAGRVFDWSHCIGMYAQSGQGFFAPSDFVMTANGTMYVACRGGLAQFARVTKLNINHEYFKEFGASGAAEGQFVWPSSVDIDYEENVYVADDFLHQVHVFDKDGKFLHRWGIPGPGEGQLNGPAGIAFDADENLLVVNAKSHRVQKFSKNGQPLGSWGKAGNGPGELDHPWGICIDGAGHVFIADWGNRRVQMFTDTGQPLVTFGAPGSGAGALNRPSSVAVDADGDVYVTDWGAHKLHIYTSDGRFITALVGDAMEPSPWAQTYINANPDMLKARRRANLEAERPFRRPVAVNVDSQKRIYVLEAYRQRIQVYSKVDEYVEHDLNL